MNNTGDKDKKKVHKKILPSTPLENILWLSRAEVTLAAMKVMPLIEHKITQVKRSLLKTGGHVCSLRQDTAHLLHLYPTFQKKCLRNTGSCPQVYKLERHNTHTHKRRVEKESWGPN